MRERDIAWLAGLLEGEAYFSIERDTEGNHNVTVVRIVLSMADKDVVERAAMIMGARSVIKKRGASYKDSYKDQYRTKISGFRAVAILREILPHMGERRGARIREQLEAWESRSTYSMGAKARCERRREAAAALAIQ